MRNKHIGGGIKVKLLSRGFRVSAPRIGSAGFPKLHLTTSGHVVTANLSYEDGGLLEFIAPLIPGEQEELNKLIESVATRVEMYLADELKRARRPRRRKST